MLLMNSKSNDDVFGYRDFFRSDKRNHTHNVMRSISGNKCDDDIIFFEWHFSGVVKRVGIQSHGGYSYQTAGDIMRVG